MGGGKKGKRNNNPGQKQQPKAAPKPPAAKPASKARKGQDKAWQGGDTARVAAGLATPASHSGNQFQSLGDNGDDASEASSKAADGDTGNATDDALAGADRSDALSDSDSRRDGGGDTYDDGTGDDYVDDSSLASDLLRHHAAEGVHQQHSPLLVSGGPLEAVIVAAVKKAAEEGTEPAPWILNAILPGTAAQHKIISKLQSARADHHERLKALENYISEQEAFVSSGAAYSGQRGRGPRQSDKRDRSKSRDSSKKKVSFSGDSNSSAKAGKKDKREVCDFVGCKFSNLRFTHTRADCNNERLAKAEGYEITQK